METLHASVEEARHHAVLVRTKVPSYQDRFKTSLCEGFVAFLTQLRDVNKELAKKLDLGIKKSDNVYFSVVEEMLQALGAAFRHLGPFFNPVA